MTRAAACLAAVLGFALLSGCTGLGVSFGGREHADGGANQWVRANTDPAQTAAEYRDCADLAESATTTEADIDQDIAAARGADMDRDQIVRMRERQMREKTHARGDAVIAACMRKKGFTRRP